MSKCKKQVGQFICDLKSKFGHPANTDRNLIFRGEPECYYAVESSLLREIKNSLKTICGSDWESVPENIFDESYFNRSMGMEVAPYVGGGIVRDLEFEAIATLQHYGAPTTLIDFSRDWRVALFFACEKLEHQCGRIIYFSSSEAKSHYNLKVQSPKGHSHDNTGQEAGRQVEQQSVLVSSQYGKFKPKSCHIVHIDWKLKPGLLAWLRSQGIHRESIYRDVHGYVDLIKDDASVWSLIHVAELLIEQKKFENAKKILRRLIADKKSPTVENIETKGRVLFLLGRSMEEQKRYRLALCHYRKARDLLLHESNGVEPRLAVERCLRKLCNKCADDAIKSIEEDLWRDRDGLATN